MKNSITWLRGAREMLGLPAWSEAAEVAYFDVVGCASDELVLKSLRCFLRECGAFPGPAELREVVEALAKPAAKKESSHG